MPFIFWPLDKVVIVGGGASLTEEDVAYCEGKAYVIAINDAYKLAPWANMLYACDHQWIQWHHGVRDYHGLKLTQNAKASQQFGWQYIDCESGDGFSYKGPIHCGHNSGFQALNIALRMSKHVALLGYDMHSRNGAHWFGEHPNKGTSPFNKFIDAFNNAANNLNGASVYNCSPDSELTCFVKANIRDVI